MKRAADFVPSPRAFQYHFTVVPEHIDELGHAGNVTWVRWVNDAAMGHSTAVGLTGDAYRNLGVVWVVRKHEIEYLWQALAGEVLRATTWVADLRGATSLRKTLFHRVADERLLVRAATTWALIDIATMRPKRIPQELLEKYGYLVDSN
jgi:acyl-CoA thioester hydrolase